MIIVMMMIIQVRKALLEVDVNLWKFYDQRILKNNVWPLVRNIHHQHYHQSPSIIVTIIEIFVLVLILICFITITNWCMQR